MDPLWLGLIFIGLVTLFFILSGRYPHPFQWLGKGVVQIVIGAFLLFLANLFGQYVDLYLPFNIVTLAIAAFLGLPGVIGLICIQWLMF